MAPRTSSNSMANRWSRVPTGLSSKRNLAGVNGSVAPLDCVNSYPFPMVKAERTSNLPGPWVGSPLGSWESVEQSYCGQAVPRERHGQRVGPVRSVALGSGLVQRPPVGDVSCGGRPFMRRFLLPVAAADRRGCCGMCRGATPSPSPTTSETSTTTSTTTTTRPWPPPPFVTCGLSLRRVCRPCRRPRHPGARGHVDQDQPPEAAYVSDGHFEPVVTGSSQFVSDLAGR